MERVNLLIIRNKTPEMQGMIDRQVTEKPQATIARLLGINARDALLSNPVLGKSWEGFVIENIRSILPGCVEAKFYRCVPYSLELTRLSGSHITKHTKCVI